MRILSIRALTVAIVTYLSTIAGQGAIQDSNPRPQDAATAILSAFDRYDIVGMTAGHSNEKLDEFILSLIRQPTFASTVNDIVVECGNSRYQPVLDRFIAGDNVPLEEARQTWRQTQVRMCALSGFYDGFFPMVRDLNLRLPKDRRLRVLVTEPAEGTNRDSSITSILTAEVLAKHRKALVLIGVGHLLHNEKRGTAVSAYEKEYPGRTFVIDTHSGFAAFFDLARGRELESRMQSWPVPSIVTVKGSWLADLDLPYFMSPFPKRMAGESYADLVDAYLYLGPGASLTYERTPDSILNDDAYLADVSRRLGAVDVTTLRKRNLDRALVTAADRAEARQFAPGAECVGLFTSAAGGQETIEIEFKAGTLAARMATSAAWTALASNGGPMSYRLTTETGTMQLDFERVGDSVDRLTLDRAGAGPKRLFVRSSGR
jgi:hypothetical protein